MYPKLYRHQFKRGTLRLKGWNYNWEAIYFITICTSNKEHFFGKISDGKMVLNELGQIAHFEWSKTEEIRKDMNLELFDFVIMPNHMHAILKIGWNQYNTQIIDPNNSNNSGSCAMYRAATMNDENIKPDIFSESVIPDQLNDLIDLKKKSNNKFGPQSKNLASIIRGFKSAVTTQIRISGNKEFEWQSRFYEHIIRDEKAFRNIQRYIINNPKNWAKK